MTKKFRIWSTKSQSWIESLSRKGLIMAALVRGERFGDWIKIQQFTGLLDKNGREIYEGDIVKTTRAHEAFVMSQIFENGSFVEYDKGIITWVNQGFNICQVGIGANPLYLYATCDCHPSALEIVGNVFETPLDKQPITS